MNQDELTKAIASDLGISDLPAEEQQKIIAEFGAVALKAATAAILEKLADDKKEEFMRLVETGNAALVQEFLTANVPEHTTIAKAAVEKEVAALKAALAM
jgi:hypothetical protein